MPVTAAAPTASWSRQRQPLADCKQPIRD